MVNNATAPPTASFDNANGTAVLEALHTLRFTDNAMSADAGPGLGIAPAADRRQGKLGMYIAAPDDIYNVIVPTDKGNVNDFGMGPLPSLTGTPAGSLGGGNDYMFAKYDTPAQIQAGIKFINFEDLTPGHGPVQLRQDQGGRAAGRLPRACSCSRARPARRSTRCGPSTRRSTPSYYAPFVNANEDGVGEPLDAQAVYHDAGPGDAGGAHRAEREHPGAAEDCSDERQRDPGQQRAVTATA